MAPGSPLCDPAPTSDSDKHGDSCDPFHKPSMIDTKINVTAEQTELLLDEDFLRERGISDQKKLYVYRGLLAHHIAISENNVLPENEVMDMTIDKYKRVIDHYENKLQKSGSSKAMSPSAEHIVPSPGLSSLSSFLSTRGVTDSSMPVSKSPYFAEAEINRKSEEEEQPQTASTSPETILNIIPSPGPPSLPSTEQFICFLSTSLLRTHLTHVRKLDSSSRSKLVYRDYDPKSPEADIIVSPKTGIILTSAHTLTQKYLPGDQGSRADIKSPLMERIFLTAPRYETLYIFICVLSTRADEQMQDAVTRLSTFCTSLDEETTVIPMIVAEADGAVASWTEYLGQAELPSVMPAINLLRSQETQWEVTMRGYGLNSFAARVVLDNGVKLNSFIDMGVEKRQYDFGELLGQRVLRRFEANIKRNKK